MRYLSAPSLRATLLSLVIVTLVSPSAVLAQTKVIDLTAAFVKNGIVIEELAVSQISNVILIQGKTNDRTRAQDASRVAAALGYQRVANLIVIRDDAADDAAIVYAGQRRLELEPALQGCRFRVDSNLGVIRVTGSVQREVQSDLAIAILKRIDGVKKVNSDLLSL